MTWLNDFKQSDGPYFVAPNKDFTGKVFIRFPRKIKRDSPF